MLEEDKYLEVDFIAKDLGVKKIEVLNVIEEMLSEKGKQKRRFKKRSKENE